MTAPTNVRTCYRHPDRVAGISCQRCERPICPACMNQASVGFHCPECARSGRQKVYQGAASWTTRPIATQVLIAINVAVYAVQLITRTMQPFTEGGRRFFTDVGLYADGSMYGPAVPDEPWRLLTVGFLHSYDLPFGFIHLGLNAYGIYIFGRMLEPALGRTRFVVLYLAATLGGSLGAALVESDAVGVGASGGVYGLLGALLVVARSRGIDLRSSGLLTTLGIWVAFTFIAPVSIGGHIGGLVLGGLGALVITEAPARLGKTGERLATPAVAVLGLASAVVAYLVLVAEYPDTVVVPF